jgi:thiamine-monophosphate kinase
MTIAEDNLIERIRRKVPSAPGDSLLLAIGDDAAVLRAKTNRDWVITCDQFIEDVHFLANRYPAEVVGYKSLARATSDIAAMGASPEIFLLSLAIPQERTGKWLNEMIGGMARAARKFGLRLAGGDTSRTEKIAMSITVMGTVGHGDELLRRDGAGPGDAIFVSGVLGGAELGLRLILRGEDNHKKFRRLLVPQFYPRPALELGQRLARKRFASAAMDISDGVSIDLQRLCKASGVGARIYAERLPLVAVPPELRRLQFDALELGLHGGEDYGLLFTVPRRMISRLPQRFRAVGLTRIGEIVGGRGVKIVGTDGRESGLKAKGWDHFRLHPEGIPRLAYEARWVRRN